MLHVFTRKTQKNVKVLKYDIFLQSQFLTFLFALECKCGPTLHIFYHNLYNYTWRLLKYLF